MPLPFLSDIAGFWPFDDNAANTTVVDATGQYVGTYGGDTQTSNKRVAGPGGNVPWALAFDGSDDRVQTSAGAMLRAAGVFSVGFWFKINASGRNDLFAWNSADAADAVTIEVNGSSKLEVYVQIDGSGGVAALGTTTISTATWYFVVVRYDGDLCEIILNGNTASPEASGNFVRNLLSHSEDRIWLGSNHSNFSPLAAFNLNGAMAGVGAFARIITDDDVASWYAGGSGEAFPVQDVAIIDDSPYQTTEGKQTACVVQAYSADALEWSIVGGADAALFEIAGNSGQLRFKSAPNYDNPLDSNGDNSYELTVRAEDSYTNNQTAIQVQVLDLETYPSGGAGAAYFFGRQLLEG